jgi:hypothetical protein
MGGTINFDAPAVLRKWPSLRNERRTEGTGPYLLVDGTLGECIREFMAKPTGCGFRVTPAQSFRQVSQHALAGFHVP